MIYDEKASTILGGFGITEDQKELLVNNYLDGTRSEILGRICNGDGLSQAERYVLIMELGVRLVFDEIERKSKQHAEQGL